MPSKKFSEAIDESLMIGPLTEIRERLRKNLLECAEENLKELEKEAIAGHWATARDLFKALFWDLK